MHGTEKLPHTPTLHAPPLPSPITAPHPTLPQPSPLLAGFLQPSQLLSDPQLRAARSRILSLFQSSRHLGSLCENPDDFRRPASAYRQIRRADALALQPAQRSLDDAILERVERDDRDARAALQSSDRVGHELIEPDQLLVRRDSQG